MQDRYAGDLGDFLKFSLLRQLRGPAGVNELPLGVVWYRVPNETHNADGKHVAYLTPGHRSASILRSLDADLYERLSEVVLAGRSVKALEKNGVLGAGTNYFSDELSFEDLPVTDRASRVARRSGWLKRALAVTEDDAVVFFDPDNGIRSPEHKTPRHRTQAVKHAYVDELAPWCERGQSIVVYHHADRSASVEAQAQRCLSMLGDELPTEPLCAVRASRGTTRLFLVAVDPEHREVLEERLRALSTSAWRDELRVIWRT
jgi:hypothetical protein